MPTTHFAEVSAWKCSIPDAPDWTSTKRRWSPASHSAGRGGRAGGADVRDHDFRLLALSAWLSEKGCTLAAMEATGVYWKPVWHILADGEFELLLANAAHVKNVPGRKTDVNDATWLSDLTAHGLIRAASSGSSDPGAAVPASTRKQLVRERSSHTQRLQKTLEDANIKLDSVISDILGVSGRA